MNFNDEMLTKAKDAKSADELLSLATFYKLKMTKQQAKAYFNQLNPKTAEVSDDKLSSVTGDGSYSIDGRLIVASSHVCDNYACNKCGAGLHYSKGSFDAVTYALCSCNVSANCDTCKYISKEGAVRYCTNEKNNNK